jgi:hypothetical protein
MKLYPYAGFEKKFKGKGYDLSAGTLKLIKSFS